MHDGRARGVGCARLQYGPRIGLVIRASQERIHRGGRSHLRLPGTGSSRRRSSGAAQSLERRAGQLRPAKNKGDATFIFVFSRPPARPILQLPPRRSFQLSVELLRSAWQIFVGEVSRVASRLSLSREACAANAHDGLLCDVPSGFAYISMSPIDGMEGGCFCGIAATMQSVVRTRLAMDAAFCNAMRVTLQGSSTPIFTMSPYCPVRAL